MSAAREELRRTLKAVIHDLERDGYAVEQVAACMASLGIHILFGEETMDALKALDLARQVLLQHSEALQ